MTTRVAVSQNNNAAACARELKAAVGALSPSFVLFFATPTLDADALSAALAHEFGAVPSLGCTTAGELVSGRMLENSVVLLAFGVDCIQQAAVHVIEDVLDDAAIQRALVSLGTSAGSPIASLDPERYVGLVLHDGLKGAEERVMAQLAQQTNVPFVGGSAGDDLKFERTVVYANFRPCTGTTALALLEPCRPYQIVKTQSFRVLDRVLTATEVDEARRVVKQFDGKPAAAAYAAALGVDVREAPRHFLRHPVGLVMENGEPFVRSPMRTSGDDILFYCQILEGSRVHLLESGDMLEDTRRDLAAALERVVAPQALISFDCVQRTRELKSLGACDEYAAIFDAVPTIGFSTYGESYIGHINQTATMLLLG